MKIIFFFVFLLNFNFVLGISNDSPDLNYKSDEKIPWEMWILKLKKDFKKNNFKDSTLKILDQIDFNSKVISYDRKQPEFKLTFSKYLQRNLTKQKIKNLKKKFIENKKLLEKISIKFNVDPKVLTSLWAIETSFGTHLGKLDIIRSLASLAYDGRRKDFFLKELNFALKILDEGHISKEDFRGSWAGAFGQTQFMPSTFFKYAIDFDNNNKINLFKKSDALASGANYLMNAGWNEKLIWGERVDLTLNNNLKKLSDKKKFKKRKFWENNGIFLENNYNENDLLRLIIPNTEENHFFLVTKNFDVILDWNRSNYFALTVFLLSNELQN